MKKAVFLLALSITFSIGFSNTYAAERLVLRYEGVKPEMARLKLQDPEMKEVYGEILDVSPETIMLETNGISHVYKLSPQAGIYCNGLPSVWYVVKFVSDRAYFEADVLLNETGEIVIINASYYGEPCVINGWTGEDGRLSLSVYIPNSDDTKKLFLAYGVRTPDGPDWLTEGREIFVLYNYKEEIRAVFLPD